ncbi:MAG: 3-deoxy-D-manno-octulosonic acid transferase [Shimia sp.]
MRNARPGPIWLHAATGRAADLRRAEALAARIADHMKGVDLLITGVGTDPLPPGRKRGEAEVFLTTHTPRAAIWLAGALHPPTLGEIAERGIPLLLTGARDDALDQPPRGFRLRAPRPLLSFFDAAHAVDARSLARLRAFGGSEGQIRHTGPLHPDTAPPPHDEGERQHLAALLGTRPVWLAMGLPPEELSAILTAHADVLRRTHRALLIVVPTIPSQGTEMAGVIAARDLRVMRRFHGEDPDGQCQVFLADDEDALGLWYRLAPLTYLGGTLVGLPSRSPMEAAALGSAVLHGPSLREHGAAFARLDEAGAAITIASPHGLGDLVGEALSPGHAAALSLAAWEVVTEGAPATNAVLDWLEDKVGLA